MADNPALDADSTSEPQLGAVDHIAVFLPSLRGGGAERVMLTLACGFAERGVKTDLVLAQASGPYLKDVPPAVRLVDLGARRLLTSVPGLVKYLRRKRPQVLLTALAPANVLAVYARALSRLPVKLIITHHNTLRHLSRAGSGYGLKGRLTPWFMRHSYPRADRIIAVSQGVADELAAEIWLHRTRIETIYNPVVASSLAGRAEMHPGHPWFVEGQPPVVLGVGRLGPQKDFQTLIRAFAIQRRKRPIRLMILGEGPERKMLENTIHQLGMEDDVSLPGFVDNPYQYMNRASVVVLSSRWEGLPCVLIEAMACGTPVISTDCPGGSSEILEGGKWGPLVPMGDVDAMAAAIGDCLDATAHPDVRRRAQMFGVDTGVANYLKLITETVSAVSG